MHIVGPTEPTLALQLFGPFEARVNGAPLPRLRSRRGVWLLALLALRSGRAIERDWLAEALWSESTPAQLSHNLSVSLTDLRRALGSEAGRLRSPRRHTLSLDLTGAAVDVIEFDAAIARGDAISLEQAVSLYRGPLLEDCSEEWAFQERQAREQAYLAAREALASHAMSRGEPAEAERHLRSVIAVEPLREKAQRALMELLAAGGNTAAALQTYRKLRSRLERELKIEPDAETQALLHQLQAEAKAAATNGTSQRRAVSAGRTLHRSVSHLPLQLTSFVGREAEMAEIQQQLGAHRLVTLTGAGGCGKTRLALETATQLLTTFPAGAWFVELAALAEPALVPQAVANALGLKDHPDRPVTQTLVEWLQPRRLLLLLDNCEHLVTACAELAETLLQRCPHLRILATSREPLGIVGERPYQVPTLSIPPREGVGAGTHEVREGIEAAIPSPASRVPAPTPQHLNALLRYEAVRLFVDRAAAAQPGFALTDENAAAVAQVCCRLDGIPLALELAAARLNALPVETLSERLGDLFGVLTNGRRTALPRHQTLRALIDWSYDLLSSAEQALLRRLSVFAGGWTLAAAEAVCPDVGALGPGTREAGDGIEARWSALPERTNAPTPERRDAVLDLLTRLVEKSLVLYEERAGEGRYRLLEMIREYARERLTGSGEVDRLRERHARSFLAFAERAGRELARGEQRPWLDRLAWEHDNLRAAIAWSAESGMTDLGLLLGSALEEFWYRRGYLREGQEQLQRLLAQPGAAAATAARARALAVAGRFAGLRHDLEAARRLHEESLAIGRTLGDRAIIAAALSNLGEVALDQWDQTTARPLVEESLALRRELGEPRGIARALGLLAQVRRRQADLVAARALMEESLSIWRALGDQTETRGALATLERMTSDQGDWEAARPFLEEALAEARERGDKVEIAWSLTRLGFVAHWQEDYPAARARFVESLPLWRELDVKAGLLHALFHLAYTFQQQEDHAAAYGLFEEMLAISREWNNTANIAFSLALLGGAAGHLGRWEEATARCADGLKLCRPYEAGDRHIIAMGLTRMAPVALICAGPPRAARLLGAAAALWSASSAPRWPYERVEFDRAAAATHAQLDETEFAIAWAEGQATPIEQIIAEALEEAPPG